MKTTIISRSGLIIAGCLFGMATATAAGPASDSQTAAGTRRGLLQSNAADTTQQGATTGDVAELQQMIRDGRLTELRTTYNGSYGAALLYYPDEMLYYVALFQQKKFWRVLKTQNDARAEATYAEFSKSTASLPAAGAFWVDVIPVPPAILAGRNSGFSLTNPVRYS